MATSKFIARNTLGRAFSELTRAEDDEDIRQAAEKGWRAAREAVYAVIGAVQKKPTGTIHPSNVVKFEDLYFGRVRGRRGGQPLSDGYSRAGQILHGFCFYDGECPRKDLVEREFHRVEDLIEQAEADISFLKESKPRRRGKRNKR